MVLERSCKLKTNQHRSHFWLKVHFGLLRLRRPSIATVAFQRWVAPSMCKANHQLVGLLGGTLAFSPSLIPTLLSRPLPCPAPFSPLPPAPLFPFLSSWRLRRAPRLHQVSRGFEPRSLDSESRVLTVTPRDHLDESERWDSTGTERQRSLVCGWRADGRTGGDAWS